jgi:lysozyme family protein
MAASNFPASLKLVLKSEGSNDDDPADHGGRTSRGITQREYDAWRHEKGAAPLDVWQAPEADIDRIYHDEYWMPYCDLLPVGSDYMFFDMAVNSGPHEAAVLLQRALGVNADGRIGPVTRQAITRASPPVLIINYSAMKSAFYKSLHQPKFLKGWLNRVGFVQNEALAMVHSANVPLAT